MTVSLCQSGSSYNDITLFLSGCMFSFLDPETSEVKHSTTTSSKEWILKKPVENSVIVTASFPELKTMDRYIFDDTLTIQADATLLCLSHPNETLDSICMVPADNFRNEMHNLYKAQVLTDMTIACGDKEFKVHKAVLASQSPVFKTMFEVDMKEKASSTIEITDSPPAVVSDLVTYLYTGTAPDIRVHATELLNFANRYELHRLFTMCENKLKMKLKVANVVDVLLLAHLHSAHYLKKACMNFIQTHKANVCKTSRWQFLKQNVDQHSSLVCELLEL